MLACTASREFLIGASLRRVSVNVLSPSGAKDPGLRQMNHEGSTESTEKQIGVVDYREIRAHEGKPGWPSRFLVR
jgi:hypothetical protein